MSHRTSRHESLEKKEVSTQGIYMDEGTTEISRAARKDDTRETRDPQRPNLARGPDRVC